MCVQIECFQSCRPCRGWVTDAKACVLHHLVVAFVTQRQSRQAICLIRIRALFANNRAELVGALSGLIDCQRCPGHICQRPERQWAGDRNPQGCSTQRGGFQRANRVRNQTHVLSEFSRGNRHDTGGRCFRSPNVGNASCRTGSTRPQTRVFVPGTDRPQRRA